jgi:hypothetical protein
MQLKCLILNSLSFISVLGSAVFSGRKCDGILGKAVLAGNLAVVKCLIEEFEANVNEIGNMTALGMAVSLPLPPGEEMVRFLVTVPGRKLGRIFSLLPARNGVLTAQMKTLLAEIAPDLLQEEVPENPNVE